MQVSLCKATIKRSRPRIPDAPPMSSHVVLQGGVACRGGQSALKEKPVLSPTAATTSATRNSLLMGVVDLHKK
jgi:hypothetical protein